MRRDSRAIRNPQSAFPLCYLLFAIWSAPRQPSVQCSALRDPRFAFRTRCLRACRGQTETLVLPSRSSQIAVDYQFPERGLLIVARTVVAVFAIVGGQAPRRCRFPPRYHLVARHPPLL